MSATETQTFLRDLDRKLWAAADKLRNNLDAAQYIDDALAAIEKENESLQNVLARDTYARLQLDPGNLRGLIDLVASIPFKHDRLQPKDILGHVYEYFLGQFALAEGKKGGQYFTPKSIVGLIVEMLQPYWGRVYDPAMGSGGFFVEIEKHVEEQYTEETHGTHVSIRMRMQRKKRLLWNRRPRRPRGVEEHYHKQTTRLCIG